MKNICNFTDNIILFKITKYYKKGLKIFKDFVKIKELENIQQKYHLSLTNNVTKFKKIE